MTTPAPPPPQFEGDEAVEEQVNGQTSAPAPAPEKDPEEQSGLDTQHSPAQIAEAKKRLDKMTPKDLINLEAVVDAYSEQFEPAFPEARAIVFTELVSDKGAKIHITSRGISIPMALDGLVDGIVYGSERYNLQVKSHDYNKPSAQPAAPVASTTGAPAAPAVTKSPSPQYSNEGNQDTQSGTDTLNKIVVLSEKVEFHVGKFRYPFQDHRVKTQDGAQIISDLFDADLGWTPDHFKGAAEYTPAQYGTLYIDWEKPGKYYNVVRKHA